MKATYPNSSKNPTPGIVKDPGKPTVPEKNTDTPPTRQPEPMSPPTIPTERPGTPDKPAAPTQHPADPKPSKPQGFN